MLGPDEELTGLRALAEQLSDAIQQRVRTNNRADSGAVANTVLAESMKAIAKATEDQSRKLLVEEYQRTVPLVVQQWVQQIPGMASGELFPRLLGTIGNPRVAYPFHWEAGGEGQGKRILIADAPYVRGTNHPRKPEWVNYPGYESSWDSPHAFGLRTFWQYCGVGDAESRPKKGATQEELLRAGKKEVQAILYAFSSYLVRMRKRSDAIAESRYLAVYDTQRERAESKTHKSQCQNHAVPPAHSNGCGTVAHPEWGAPGTVWRPGHMAAHAHRMVAKEFLRGLYKVWPEPKLS